MSLFGPDAENFGPDMYRDHRWNADFNRRLGIVFWRIVNANFEPGEQHTLRFPA